MDLLTEHQYVVIPPPWVQGQKEKSHRTAVWTRRSHAGCGRADLLQLPLLSRLHAGAIDGATGPTDPSSALRKLRCYI
jgi:hypothetical protein